MITNTYIHITLLKYIIDAKKNQEYNKNCHRNASSLKKNGLNSII